MAVDGVNKEVLDYLVGLLFLRLSSKGQKAVAGKDGTVHFEDCDIFKREALEESLKLSISAFNVACGTYYGLADEEFCKYFSSLLVGYAVSVLLSSQALLERGREFSTSDHGVSMTAPNISSLAWEQSINERNWWERQILTLTGRDDFHEEWVKKE
jgi:hypothetical protein